MLHNNLRGGPRNFVEGVTLIYDNQSIMIHMALIPTYSSMFTKDQVPPLSKSTKLNERSTANNSTILQNGCKCFCSFHGDRRPCVVHHTTSQTKRKIPKRAADMFSTVCKKPSMSFEITSGLSTHRELRNREYHVTFSSKKALQIDKIQMTVYASKSSSTEGQLEALHSYFSKLRNESHKQTTFLHSKDADTALTSENTDVEPASQFQGRDFKAEQGLDSLENYLRKLRAIKSHKSNTTSAEITEKKPSETPYIVNDNYERSEAKKMKSYVQSRNKVDEPCPENSQVLQSQEETSDLYLICALVSINIGVFLFEIASPVKNSDVELLTLPSLYGAKINHLILDGEWWRLVTPMFLHSGILHVALGFWVLLTFGPQVCKGYGSFTFFLIYILGGISGNLISYIHTPEPTVGGTGPVFAIIGAWIIYQIQNKQVIQKDVTESMFRKAVIATVLSFVLSSFGPIDDWTHLGAVCVGIAYGLLTCPTLQLDDSSSKSDEKNGYALVRRYADPFKSIVMFVVFIIILSSLLLFVDPQVNTLENNFM